MFWIQGVMALMAVCLLALGLGGPVAHAASSEPFESEAMAARLVTAENGVAPGAATVSAGLHIDLSGDWKSYWRSPGEVGMPPQIDWSGSTNIEKAEFLWPAPTRFEAFGIENFGYKDEVLYPIKITLAEAGEPAVLDANVTLLVCETICVPETFRTTLELDEGDGIDRPSAELIARFAEAVPLSMSDDTPPRAALTENGEALVIDLRGELGLEAPDVFVEDGTYGRPEIVLADEGRHLWASLPVLKAPQSNELTITLTDGSRAMEYTSATKLDPAPRPEGGRTLGTVSDAPGAGILAMLALALLGGLILNVMPCVLPVLSIKLASAVNARDQAPGRVRRGFVAAALGVLAFVWALAAGTIALRSAGVAVGWGLQFQNAAFLAMALSIVLLFAANMLGLYEIALPSSLGGRLARAGGRESYAADFATGAFAALLATPCSAPFLGTAVAFALAGGATDVWLIFTALGLGLAAPYLLVAARPGLVRLLPKPGAWMTTLRTVLGLMLLATGVWLAWVLAGVAGAGTTIAVVLLVGLAIAVLAWRPERLGWSALGGATALVALAIALPATTKETVPGAPVEVADDLLWEPFERALIARNVAMGRVVFVDVTADWCLTCKVNKSTTLSRERVSSVLSAPDVNALRADWTRPNDEIRRYLSANGRYGIPFNAVYGPGAPEGILLPEVLTVEGVLEAIERARTPPGTGTAEI